MDRRIFCLSALGALGACVASAPEPQLGADGRPLPQLYRIRPGDTNAIQFRMLDGVNALREASGLSPVSFSAQLNAAAATHARDMSVQNRPWHFGSDGSSPLDRAARVGYAGLLLGENISETFETELETLAAWMQDTDSRSVILDARAEEMGFAWFQEPGGKIWWTLNLGTQAIAAPNLDPNALVDTTEQIRDGVDLASQG